MTTSPVPFSFEGQPVRIIDRDGNPWFVLADVCRVLEHSNSREVASRLDDDEKDTVSNADGGIINDLGTVGAMPTIVNESGLYSLILTSRKPAAKRFKKWVTSEVIPSIRKTGGYGMADIKKALHDPYTLRALLAESNEQVLALTDQVKAVTKQVEDASKKIEVMQDDVKTFGLLCKAEGSVGLIEAAKILKCRTKGKNGLPRFMRSKKWIFRPGGKGEWQGYTEIRDKGYLDHKLSHFKDSDGEDRVSIKLRVTALGLAVLSKMDDLPRIKLPDPQIPLIPENDDDDDDNGSEPAAA